MKVIVVGGVGLPEQVAAVLRDAGDEVTMIESAPGREQALVHAGLHHVVGDPLVPATLEAAGALKADVLLAVTQSDEDNLVISLLGKRRCGVPKVVARVNDPANEALFDSTWGVDALVSPASAFVSMIKQP
jgi:trk system potassium uptake protein